MRRHDILLIATISNCRRAVALAAIVMATLPSGVVAQRRSARDTATTYGARLDAKGAPADLNPNRINNRINNRLETRIAFRIDRYRSGSVTDSTAALTVQPTDNARLGTATTVSSVSMSGSSSMAKANEASPQMRGQIEDAPQPH